MANAREIELTRKMMALYEDHGIDRRQFLKMLSAVGGGMSLTALLAACGDDEDDEPTSAPAATPTTAAESPVDEDEDEEEATDEPTEEDEDDESDDEPTSAPSTGGATPKVLVIGNGQDISNFDPHTGYDEAITAGHRSVYSALLIYEGNPPRLVNQLATSVEANDDASEWTITLDERAVFHDGTPVTASDVAFSVGRYIRKGSALSWLFSNVMDEDGAEVIDDHTVKFNLHTPFAPLSMAFPWLFIANEKLVMEHEVDGDEGEGWLLENEAGSGPFIIKSWNPGDSYEFEALPDYWGGWPEEGRLAGYIWRIMRESSSRRLGLLNGDVHIAGLSADDFAAMQGESGFQFVAEELGYVFSLRMNNAGGYTADPNMRKAISYAMDYESVLDIYRGNAALLHGPLPAAHEYAALDLEVPRQDMDKAREYLAMTDYPDGGIDLEFVMVTGIAEQEQIGLILLENLSELNINLKITPLVWPDMVARMADPELAADLTCVLVAANYPDPDAFMFSMYHSSQAGTFQAASHYNNPEFDALIERGRATSNQEERKQIYHDAQKLLIDDAVDVWLYTPLTQTVLSEQVGGYEFCPLATNMFKLWLKD
jgi:peptide/nickel transport system substrate-binding protein